MKRAFDILLGLVAGLLLAVPIIIIWLAVKITSKGPAIYWSDRVGIDNTIFKMPKFRC